MHRGIFDSTRVKHILKIHYKNHWKTITHLSPQINTFCDIRPQQHIFHISPLYWQCSITMGLYKGHEWAGDVNWFDRATVWL